ncbi:helix-turn-helix domain-containing protein [Soonwooa sp.]|uniref:helix-turn-helix domain-containing protein n=1 Tax=Soonwooa sp. TaxID=1938592 RepID=UPI00260D3A5C|nr:helix-turn-helix domain-containing protein [Soonwooa sp.]
MNNQNIFRTFKPQDLQVQKYVDYYYLDIKPENIITEYECFPHYNNTISLYKSHNRLDIADMKFLEIAKPIQIFTPVREKVLNVKQTGKVHRIVIVFKAFGINQFYKNIDFSTIIHYYSFFTDSEIQDLLSSEDVEIITKYLDRFLLLRFQEISNPIIEKSLISIFENTENFNVEKLSKELGISRKHINRVFKQNIGVPIKKFHQIVAFRKTVEKKLHQNSVENFTQIAHEFQFFDQSHFNKVYKNFTNNSPKAFFNKASLLGQEDIVWHLKD